ncbi:hypothetical protein QTP88_029164 [Uroleucon formosanum]
MFYVIQERLKPYLLSQICQEQAGFVPGRGTRYQFLNNRQIIEKCYEYNITVICCFLDYTKAFDMVKWNLLWSILKEMRVPEHLIAIIKIIYTNGQAHVRVESDLSESFRVGQGVKQDCVLSPHATQEWNGGVSIGGKKISNLRYADDTVLLAKTEMEMANLLELVEKFSNEAGLKLNRSKCSIIAVDRTRTLPLTFNLIPNIDRKDNVIYLGALLSNKGGLEEEIKRRVGMAKAAIAKLVKIWKDHDIRKGTKLYLMKTLIFPIMIYGSESWTLNSSCQRRIEAFEMIAYRRMLRIPWTDHRTNVSIVQELNIQPQDRLLMTIQSQILKFFGHVMRRDGIEKDIIQGKNEGKRSRGRPPIRYIDQIKNLTQMSISDNIRNTENREKQLACGLVKSGQIRVTGRGRPTTSLEVKIASTRPQSFCPTKDMRLTKLTLATIF